MTVPLVLQRSPNVHLAADSRVWSRRWRTRQRENWGRCVRWQWCTKTHLRSLWQRWRTSTATTDGSLSTDTVRRICWLFFVVLHKICSNEVMALINAAFVSSVRAEVPGTGRRTGQEPHIATETIVQAVAAAHWAASQSPETTGRVVSNWGEAWREDV